MSGSSTNKPYINPRFRAYGRARVDIAQRAQTREDWDRLWKKPQYPFAFDWGEPWKQCIEYRVDDFPAEVGFLIDVLGFPVRAFSPEFAMFTSPDEAFNFAVVPTPQGTDSTPPDAIRLQFMLADLFATCEALAQRGVIFDHQAQPVGPNAHLWIAAFHTPHGIPVELWGLVETPEGVLESPEDEVASGQLDEIEDEMDEFEPAEPDEEALNRAFEAAKRRVAADRPDLASASPPARPTAPPEKPPLKNLKTSDDVLSSLGAKPAAPAPKLSPTTASDSPVHTFEPTYEPLDEEDDEEAEPEVRRFPQEYHYRPIRLDETPDKDPE